MKIKTLADLKTAKDRRDFLKDAIKPPTTFLSPKQAKELKELQDKIYRFKQENGLLD